MNEQKPLTPEEQAVLDKAIAVLESDPFRCGTPFFIDWEERRKAAERTGQSPYKLTELWNKMVADIDVSDDEQKN